MGNVPVSMIVFVIVISILVALYKNLRTKTAIAFFGSLFCVALLVAIQINTPSAPPLSKLESVTGRLDKITTLDVYSREVKAGQPVGRLEIKLESMDHVFWSKFPESSSKLANTLSVGTEVTIWFSPPAPIAKSENKRAEISASSLGEQKDLQLWQVQSGTAMIVTYDESVTLEHKNRNAGRWILGLFCIGAILSGLFLAADTIQVKTSQEGMAPED